MNGSVKESVQWTKKVPALTTMPGTFKETLWRREQATNSNTLAFYPVLLSLCNFPAPNFRLAAGFLLCGGILQRSKWDG